VDDGPTAGPAEALVLDIGGDIGALILYADESCLGMEVDLTPVGAPRSHHMHTMIRRRRAVDREFIAGVYPELVEGVYTVWGIDGPALGEVMIQGGHVSEFRSGDCRSLA
jgi:selenophosphate synthetase-related protein